MGLVFVGHDWAEIHHDIYIEDSDGNRHAFGCGLGGLRSNHLMPPVVALLVPAVELLIAHTAHYNDVFDFLFCFFKSGIDVALHIDDLAAAIAGI